MITSYTEAHSYTPTAHELLAEIHSKLLYRLSGMWIYSWLISAIIATLDFLHTMFITCYIYLQCIYVFISVLINMRVLN